MIRFESITKTFKVDFWDRPFEALSNVSFEVKEGQIVGFLGANGAGKTTSLKILMGFIHPDAGQFHYSKELGKTRDQVFRRIGYLPERPYFYPHLTGTEFCRFMAELQHVPKTLFKQNLAKWAERFRVDFALDRKLRTYSKGMLQRIGFVATLIHEPKLIILDEPLSGLDPIGRMEIKQVIVELHKQGKTIFFSSHIVPDVEEICQSVVFLEKGQLVYQGSIDRLITENLKPSFTFKLERAQGIHFKAPLKIVSPDGSDFLLAEVEYDHRDQFLAEIMEKRLSLLGLHQNKPTLEEILYKVRGQS